MMLGMMEGKRKRGGPRMHCMDRVKDTTDLSLDKLREETSDRSKWRNHVMG